MGTRTRRTDGRKVSSGDFYAEYHGHRLDLLDQVLKGLDSRAARVFLAGDSSLDNKHWLFHTFDKRAFFTPHSPHAHSAEDDEAAVAPAVGGYENVLSPPLMAKDVAYWCAREAEERGKEVAVVNCAVEESAVGDRDHGRLLPQDEFVRDNLRAHDILIVSVGGNDVALKPTARTLLSMVGLTLCTPGFVIRRWRTGLGLGHMLHLFGQKVEDYIISLTAKTRPHAVIVCSIYYPCAVTQGWASTILNMAGYRRNPGHLQALIQLVHDRATRRITLPPRTPPECGHGGSGNAGEGGCGAGGRGGGGGRRRGGGGGEEDGEDEDGTAVIPLKLCEVLDANDAADYEEQVEPSVKGGRKMAKAFMDALEKHGVL